MSISYGLELERAKPSPPESLVPDPRTLEVQDFIGRTRLVARQESPDPTKPYPLNDSVLGMMYEEPLVPPIANALSFAEGMTDPLNARPTIRTVRPSGLIVVRNARTAGGFKRVVTGPQHVADGVIDHVFAVHAVEHARAVAQANGPHPERAAEDPFGPERGIFTSNILAKGWKTTFEHIVQPLTPIEDVIFREADMPLFAGFFGAGVSRYPDQAVRERLERGELRLTPATKDVARRNWDKLTVPLWMKIPKQWMVSFVLGVMEPEIRAMYGFEYGPAQEKAFHKAVERLSKINRMLKEHVSFIDDTNLINAAARKERWLNRFGLIPPIPDPYAETA